MSNSLGFRAPVIAPRTAPTPSTETVSLEVIDPSDPSMKHGRSLLRLCVFALVTGAGIYAFADPVPAIELITTVDVSNEKASMLQLSSLIPPAAADIMGVDMFEDILKVITRVFASLIIVAAGGILSRDVFMFRILVVISQCTAAVLFIATAVMDNGGILKLWFVLAYLSVACILPVIVTSYEAVTIWRAQ